jgi:hypothetical protein
MGSSAKEASPRGTNPPGNIKLTAESECLLNVTGRHFLVKIQEVKDDVLRVTFPGKDYPITGMKGNIEFHDAEGFFYYPFQVIEGPNPKHAGIAIRRSSELKRSKHRDSCRVPTDLMVQVKDESHVRHYNGDLLNIGAGGALIQSEAPFDYSTIIELTLSLPGDVTRMIRCHIVEILSPGGNVRPALNRYCLRFFEIDADAQECITRYVWERLRQMYPDE